MTVDTAESEFLRFMEEVYPDPVDREDRFAELLMREAGLLAMGIIIEGATRPRPARPRGRPRRPEEIRFLPPG